MAEAMRFMIGNTKCIIMDDFCSYPDQKERDARARKNVGGIAYLGLRAVAEKQQGATTKANDGEQEGA